MTNRDLLKEAIADAKTLKETAIANAKAALEEAFEPRLQAMLSAKLEEMEAEEMMEDEVTEEVKEMKGEEMEEGYDKDMDEAVEEAVEEMDEEMELDEILAELDEEVNESEEISEEVVSEEEVTEADEDEDEAEASEDEEVEDMDDEEIDLEEMTEDELKDFIEDVIKDMVEAGELEAGEEFDAEEEMDMDMDMDDEEIEIEADEEEVAEIVSEEVINEEEEIVTEGFMDLLTSFQEWLNYAPTSGMFRGSDMTNLQSLLTMLSAMGGVGLGMIAASRKDAKDAQAKKNAAALEDAVKAVKDGVDPKKAAEDLKAKADAAIARSKELTGAMEEGEAESMDEGSYDDVMEEVNTLRAELHEVNLLNAKLLYTNKIFRAKNLKEAQKVKVLEAFDKAETVKEVKLVFETLTEEVVETKTVVKENLGRASKAAGVAQKAPIVEVDPQVTRWQKLAGIK